LVGLCKATRECLVNAGILFGKSNIFSIKKALTVMGKQ
jgi:hypothetical protein